MTAKNSIPNFVLLTILADFALSLSCYKYIFCMKSTLHLILPALLKYYFNIIPEDGMAFSIRILNLF